MRAALTRDRDRERQEIDRFLAYLWERYRADYHLDAQGVVILTAERRLAPKDRARLGELREELRVRLVDEAARDAERGTT